MAQLRRLNLDSSWLLTLPAAAEWGRRTFNLLIDPWLDPAEQVDYARSFSAQRRRTTALVPSIASLETLLQREAVEGHDGPTSNNSDVDRRPRSTSIDAILISHPFTDHMHPQTLLCDTCPARIPLLASSDAFGPLKALVGKERLVIKIDVAKSKERPALLSETGTGTNGPLPSNIAVLNAAPQERFLLFQGPAGMAWQKLHGGIVVLWKQDADAPSFHSLLYSPHGIAPTSVPAWLAAESDPLVEPWAIMTSYDRIELPRWLSGTVNLGLAGALKLLSGGSDVASAYPARFVVDTHNEHKDKQGLVAQLLRRYWLASTDEVKHFDEKREGERREQAQQQINSAGSSSRAVILDVGQTLSLQS